MKAFRGPTTRAAFLARFVESTPATCVTFELSLVPGVLPTGSVSLDRAFVTRVLLDAPSGFALSGVVADDVRFLPGDHSGLSEWIESVEILTPLRGRLPSARVAVLLAPAVEHALEAGQRWDAAVITPLGS